LAPVAAAFGQQTYNGGQAWQKNECHKLVADPQERSRCMASASTSFDDYKRQANAAKSAN
jgi:hypothetical protein